MGNWASAQEKKKKKAINCDLHLKMLVDSLIFRAERDCRDDPVQRRLRPGKDWLRLSQLWQGWGCECRYPDAIAFQSGNLNPVVKAQSMVKLYGGSKSS